MFWNLLSCKILWYIWRIRNLDRYQGTERVLTESFRRLTFHTVFSQITMVIRLNKEKFRRFLEDGHTRISIYELSHGYTWGRMSAERTPFISALDALMDEIRGNGEMVC